MAGIGNILASTGAGALGGSALGPIGAAIGGGIGLLKGIFGGVQAAKGNKQMNSLMKNYPTQTMSQGYQDAFKIYQNMANSNLPGYDIMKGQIDQSAARTQTNLERGAMGSNQLMSGILSSQDKELDAIKNLGLMSAQWKAQQQGNLAQQDNVMGQQQNELWQQNVGNKWGIQMNMANEKRGAGVQNLFSGLGDISSSLQNYAGTQSLMKFYKSQQAPQILPATNAGDTGD